ncbi:hypothetical protein AHiyo8_21420 [Arthrobacter sp. Hiyo8]|nr:hypothetical protein AHiyo8_21420 [Arthrobacter sp. Hiyo8]
MDYVRQLAARGITALAIETGPDLPAIPESMLDAGQEAGLPIIELCKVAPFVGIMQAINSLLVSESVAQLQFGDETSHAMAAELAHGGGLDQLLAVLAGRTVPARGSSRRRASLWKRDGGRAARVRDRHHRRCARPRRPCGPAGVGSARRRRRQPRAGGRRAVRRYPRLGPAATHAAGTQGTCRHRTHAGRQFGYAVMATAAIGTGVGFPASGRWPPSWCVPLRLGSSGHGSTASWTARFRKARATRTTRN